MFSVTIVNIKDIIKYLVSTIITLTIVMFLTRYFSNENNNKKENIAKTNLFNICMQNSMLICLDETIPGIKATNEELNEKEDLMDQETLLGKLLKVELSMFNFEEEEIELPVAIEKTIEQDEKLVEPQVEQYDIKPVQETPTGVQTEIVTEKPLVDSYNVMYNTVKIKNETSYELSQEMLGGFQGVNKQNIVIFHTHTCESYTSSSQFTYVPTGNFRTTDLNYSVVRVGNELTNYLLQYGYNVIHDSTYHDYPSYTGSYTRSLATVQKVLEGTSSDIIIDLHRDAIGSNSAYAPTVRIGEDYAAQLMFVIGTNGGGLWHPNWNTNLQFAVKIQEKANEMYPGLFKPIILRNSRYNQHVGKAACIIEVGATGNSLEQCLTSMKYLSKVINEI